MVSLVRCAEILANGSSGDYKFFLCFVPLLLLLFQLRLLHPDKRKKEIKVAKHKIIIWLMYVLVRVYAFAKPKIK